MNPPLARAVGFPLYRLAHWLTTDVVGCAVLYPCAPIPRTLVVPLAYRVVAPAVAAWRLAVAGG